MPYERGERALLQYCEHHWWQWQRAIWLCLKHHTEWWMLSTALLHHFTSQMVILRHRQGFWSCFTLIWYKICNEIHFAAPSGLILPILPTKKTNEIGHFAAPSGIQMMFSIEFDERIVMKKIRGAVRDGSSWRHRKNPWRSRRPYLVGGAKIP